MSASVSPPYRYAGNNPTALTFTAIAAVWLIVVQWVSSFFGGYLAGRLRPNLSGVHATEVTFRDTAAGLTAWALAAVLTVVVAGSGISGLLKNASQAASHHVASAHVDAYALNVLFRSPQTSAETEPGRIMARRMLVEPVLAKAASGPLNSADYDYLTQLVSAQAGVPGDEAGRRVDAVIAQEQDAIAHAKQAADTARKSAAELAFYTCFSMMVGAFIAAIAGAIGGRQRDTF